VLKNIKFLSLSLVAVFMALVGSASAHVAVQPSQVGVASFQVFTINVPTEKDNPTVAVKLLVPSGVKEVTPTVKPGWQINVVRDSKDNVSEIDWTGGSIPADFRDEFTFSAQAPDNPGNINWKAYQTYQDGSVVSWDATPSNSDDATGDKGPYSVTKVVNDLSPAPATTNDNSSTNMLAYIISVVALAIAVISFTRVAKKR
jgi:uncharacterized protein YcnI